VKERSAPESCCSNAAFSTRSCPSRVAASVMRTQAPPTSPTTAVRTDDFMVLLVMSAKRSLCRTRLPISAASRVRITLCFSCGAKRRPLQSPLPPYGIPSPEKPSCRSFIVNLPDGFSGCRVGRQTSVKVMLLIYALRDKDRHNREIRLVSVWA